jgi:rod shape-determining protein MreD
LKGFLFFLAVGTIIFVAQTTLLAAPGLQVFRYDLFIPFVVFMALYQPVHVGLSLAILFGFVMDVFSGGVFGLFLFTYFWFFCLIRAGLEFLDLQNSILETVLVLLGVLAENLIVIFFLSFFGREDGIRFWALQNVVVQVFVAGVTAPLIFLTFSKSGKRARKSQRDFGLTIDD